MQVSVSIVIAAFNAEKHIGCAIRSVLDQTMSDVEVLVVDDGSSDQTAATVLEICRQDARVRLISLPRNAGQAAAINVGIELVRGRYLALLDADDFAPPDRLALQLNAFAQDPDLILVGGAVRTWCGSADQLGRVWQYACSDQRIRALSLFKAEFINGAMMFDMHKLRAHRIRLNERLQFGADWEISLQAMQHGKVINLPDVVMHYRIHPAQVTVDMADTLASDSTAIRRQVLQALGVDFSEQELMCHLAVSPCNYWRFGSHPYFLALKPGISAASDAWFAKLLAANAKSGKVCQDVLRNILDELRCQILNTLREQERRSLFECPVVGEAPCLSALPCR